MYTGMGGYGAMGGGMGMSMSDGNGMYPDDRFRSQLRMAIARISSSDNDQEKAELMQFTQAALAQQYDAMITRRKAELQRLKDSLLKLENDLQKRETAKDRVIKLQMQTVTLAAEGLLDLNTLQPTNDYSGGYGAGEMGMGN